MRHRGQHARHEGLQVPPRRRPGATINISLLETVPHPGYFRISFDNDGDDDFVIPTGTSGEFGNCSGDPKCGAGKEDFCSNETVLIDNLEPHRAGGFATKRTFSVTLPNVECANCTLQVIQMMNDFNLHPVPYPADDIYYRCIDIELSKDAPEVTEAPAQNVGGMVCPRSDPPMTGGMDMGATGGVVATGGMDTTMTGGVVATGGMISPMSGGVIVTGGMVAPMTGGVDTGVTGGVIATSGGDMAPAGSGGAVASGGTPVSPVVSSDSGCQLGAGSSTGVFAPLAMALFVLGRRRRNAAR